MHTVHQGFPGIFLAEDYILEFIFVEPHSSGQITIARFARKFRKLSYLESIVSSLVLVTIENGVDVRHDWLIDYAHLALRRYCRPISSLYQGTYHWPACRSDLVDSSLDCFYSWKFFYGHQYQCPFWPFFIIECL